MDAATKILAVALGGAFGAAARYLLGHLLAGVFAPFPSATFLINVTGSFALGLLLTLFGKQFESSEHLRLALTVGFLGAYTTFSTFEFETFALLNGKQTFIAVLYVFSSVALGLFAVWLGVLAGQRL